MRKENTEQRQKKRAKCSINPLSLICNVDGEVVIAQVP